MKYSETVAIGPKLAKIRCVAEAVCCAALLSAALMLFTAINANAATYEVTNSAPRGTGSFIEAVQMANGNPGPDTIDIKVNVNGVTSVSCGLLGVGDPYHFYMATVTDDLVIEGNGHAIQGAGFWVTPEGLSNVPGTCPARVPGITIVAEAPGFLRVESGSVTVKDLKLLELSAIVEVRQGAGNLTLERVYGYRIFDFFRDCERPAIDFNSGNNSTARTIKIKDSTFEESWNHGAVLPTSLLPTPWLNAFILGFDTNAVLEISNSSFDDFAGIPVFGYAHYSSNPYGLWLPGLAAAQLAVRLGLHRRRLLHQAVEQLAPGRGGAPVEAESELVQVII